MCCPYKSGLNIENLSGLFFIYLRIDFLSVGTLDDFSDKNIILFPRRSFSTVGNEGAQMKILFARDSRRGLQMPMMMRAMPRRKKPMRG